MTAAALTPRVRMMAICDRVRESRIEAGVFDLKGVRQQMIADAFPFAPRRLRLFLVLSSPQAGEFPWYVRVIHDRTDRAIYYSYLAPRPTFDADNGLFRGRAGIRCSFPEEGQYTVQVSFFRAEGNDVIKGELPFFVTAEWSDP